MLPVAKRVVLSRRARPDPVGQGPCPAGGPPGGAAAQPLVMMQSRTRQVRSAEDRGVRVGDPAPWLPTSRAARQVGCGADPPPPAAVSAAARTAGERRLQRARAARPQPLATAYPGAAPPGRGASAGRPPTPAPGVGEGLRMGMVSAASGVGGRGRGGRARPARPDLVDSDPWLGGRPRGTPALPESPWGGPVEGGGLGEQADRRRGRRRWPPERAGRCGPAQARARVGGPVPVTAGSAADT